MTRGGGATRGNATISRKRIQQLAMRARVRPAAGDKRALPARAASDRQINGARGEGNVGRVVGAACASTGKLLRLQWPHAARAMTQTATIVMATHDMGKDRQIASARDNGDAGQVDGLRRECNDGQIVVLAVATRIKGNDGQVAGARDGHARQRQRRANCQRTR